MFVAMTEDEMRGVLCNLGPRIFSTEPKKRREEFLRAAVEHYFEKHLFGDMPIEFGQKVAEDLLLRITHETDDRLSSQIYIFCVSQDSSLKVETDEDRKKIAENLMRFVHLTLTEFRVSMGWDRRCPKCGIGVMRGQEDEDEWWSECGKCGHTDNHSIKPGFG